MRPDGTRLRYCATYNELKPGKCRAYNRRYFGSPVRLEMRDVARILGKSVASVRYALNEYTRSQMKAYAKRLRGVEISAEVRSEVRRRSTQIRWAKEWRDQYRRELGIIDRDAA